ncbi:MAG TPA: glycosyltransferase family 4 protein [Actinomycetota bacterium]|nr:glycosyltransferase family 4 protein [Actinomycetota bacterium]
MRVLLVQSHPVQYAAPLLRRYAREEGLDARVAFLSLRGAAPSVDRDFGVEVAWDVPLLDGYAWTQPPDRAGSVARRLLGSVNPGLWRIVRRGAFDVVVCYGYRAASFWIAAVAAKSAGAKLMWATDATRISPWARGPLHRWKVPVKKVALPAIFGLADAVLAPSTRTVRFLSGIGVPPSRVFIAPFVVDNEFFERGAAAADREAVRADWGVPADGLVALFAGKLAPWKRPGDLLEAAARVPEVFVVFAGDGVLREELAERARHLGLAERVRFQGFVNQSALPATYRAADVLVLPSEFEPFGLVVNEAFASGTPAIVSTACGAVDDLIREGETGFTYPPGDVAALAGHLEALARSPELRERLVRGARDQIGQWGVDQNVEAFTRAVRAVARGGRADPESAS